MRIMVLVSLLVFSHVVFASSNVSYEYGTVRSLARSP